MNRCVWLGKIETWRPAAANNSIDLVFGWDPSEPVATRPLVLQKYGQYNLFYTHDGNKNVSELVFFQQANGIAAHYEYAPFGAVIATSRSTPVTAYDFREYNPFRFSSEYADDMLGLVYYNYRHYNLIDGRWTSRDCDDGGNLTALYVFCDNDANSRIDRNGLNPYVIFMGEHAISVAETAFCAGALCVASRQLSNTIQPSIDRVADALEDAADAVVKVALSVADRVSYVSSEVARWYENKCDELNAAVANAKTRIGAFHPARCNADMSCYELNMRKSAWLDLAAARAHRDKLCWGGGDEGHQEAQASAWIKAAECAKISMCKGCN